MRTTLALTLLLAACGDSSTQPPPVQPAPQAPPSSSSICADKALTLQVLGSGGPIPENARASSGYLLWHGGKSRLLVDIGGGVILRFGEAGASVGDLDAVAISHLHADHVADLPALLKAGYFAERTRPLKMIGPTGNDRFPAFDAFITGLIDPETGLFRYLSGYRDGSEGLFRLDVVTIPADAKSPVTAASVDGLELHAVGVHHHHIPSLGFVASVDGKRIAFSGDQSAENAPFAEMIAGADLLVVHHAIPESSEGGVLKLHRTPSQIGDLAKSAKVKRIVLSHNMGRALADLDGALSLIKARYGGPIDVATDLACYPLK